MKGLSGGYIMVYSFSLFLKKKKLMMKFQDNKKPHLQMRFFVCAKIERLKYRKFYYFKSNFKALIK